MREPPRESRGGRVQLSRQCLELRGSRTGRATSPSAIPPFEILESNRFTIAIDVGQCFGFVLLDGDFLAEQRLDCHAIVLSSRVDQGRDVANLRFGKLVNEMVELSAIHELSILRERAAVPAAFSAASASTRKAAEGCYVY
jgi:hypothetical protein